MKLIYNTDCMTSFLCDDIIELYENQTDNDFIIPKNDKYWRKIENMLYKELLGHLIHYKNQ